MSVLMSESFINSFNRFIQTADSFKNESIGCLCEWATESIDSLDSFKHVMKHRCVLLGESDGDTQQFCCGFDCIGEFSLAKLSKNSQYFV